MSSDLAGYLGFRFHSDRAVPKGTKIKATKIGPLVVVEGSVPGGPHVIAPCAIVEGLIVLEDGLFFEHEMKPLRYGVQINRG